MIKEVIDSGSGAILFKKDEGELALERLEKEVSSLKRENTKYKKRLEELEIKVENLMNQ